MTEQPPTTLRDVLLQVLAAYQYPCLGNGDFAVSIQLEKEALQHSEAIAPCADDPPEFAQWLAVLRSPKSSNAEHEAVYSAMLDYFQPEAS